MTNTELYFNLVKEFMTTFDQKAYRFTSDVPSKTLALRATLIEEEEKEYNAARVYSNRLEILDGLCDLAYVTAGLLVTCGLTAQPYSYESKCEPSTLEPEISFVIEECHVAVPCHKRMYRYTNNLLKLIDTNGSTFDMRNAFIAVHQNNMEKLWTKRPNDNSLIVVPKGNKFLVKRPDGKVVKPANHQPPNLKLYL